RAGVLEVQRHALLVAVEGLEEVAVAVAEEVRPNRAADVAALGRVLDLDHLGAEVGEQHAAERAGTVLLDRDDAQSRQGKHGEAMSPSLFSRASPGRCGR